MARSAPTIPFASTSGEPELSITSDDWSKIENAYGHSLPEDVRQKILEATTTFVYFEVFERTAEQKSSAIMKVRSVESAAKGLFLALHPDAPSDVSHFADQLINNHFDDLRLASGDKLRHLSGVLTSLGAACNLALQKLGDPNMPGYREGECWDQWVRRLTAIAKSEGLPTAASKGSDKETGDTSSPFVLLVWELQACVPEDARRHWQSKHALAAAIHRARRDMARKPRRDTKGTRASKKMSRRGPQRSR